MFGPASSATSIASSSCGAGVFTLDQDANANSEWTVPAES
jgi:hypothetical protein